MTTTDHLHLAVALDGAGWHPAAWRAAGTAPADLLSADHSLGLVRQAEAGLLDLVTFEDSFAVQSSSRERLDERTDQVRGRLDALLLASRLAPLTKQIGLVPTVTTTHTEPFHVSTSVATLDWVSRGRAGWRVQVSARDVEAEQFGRREAPHLDLAAYQAGQQQEVVAELFDEAADVVEVVRRLWDSWEDDAIIRDASTGRFVDRDKLHYVEFEGRWFSVKGPSIVPRSPQGQPVVVALAHARIPYELAARSADVVLVTPHDDRSAAAIEAEVRAAEAAVTRRGTPLQVWGEVLVLLDDNAAVARSRKERLDELDGAPLESDALVFTGTPGQLADQLLAWRERGYTGFRLRPGVAQVDVPHIVHGLVPELQRRGAFRTAYEADTLRGLLDLAPAANRYAAPAA
ncbi:alkanesulfonate monooxygenase SsuD/methylene tetrahydromethanopterin reductase-like flavin-dependent oxidoreductase (luciferase family) [Motilibacter peucedani]|uniref:Alkanesulfonate monooxygenase SsuD/methylene tetrahydromethanopterin reductase-like flavin-dependent oxidoreductase (Luciferase family) n=1 Tax=Motilibacter peucedani TaxID=598650 RepID=A0A420XK07_9ACTN|nr:LLM class flavin-dependent oxidoreductase [Motilibacter peucedani]RKS68452.1 alkanesulfonate monooxygenase SsuD/methylene tetrahydromethanopterin reductase-like flavin-dependent oxidoreductase (luciferase family) [Motilibacter peucedani]